MSMQSEGKDAKGRNYHQSTRDGTGSAASVGPGGTGDIGKMGSQRADQGSQQSDSRSDDLLATDTGIESEQAFGGGSQGGKIQTGMEGIGKGAGSRQSGQQSGQQANRQSGEQAGRQGDLPSGDTDADQYDQGSAPRER